LNRNAIEQQQQQDEEEVCNHDHTPSRIRLKFGRLSSTNLDQGIYQIKDDNNLISPSSNADEANNTVDGCQRQELLSMGEQHQRMMKARATSKLKIRIGQATKQVRLNAIV
jgi:hypothetical protein